MPLQESGMPMTDPGFCQDRSCSDRCPDAAVRAAKLGPGEGIRPDDRARDIPRVRQVAARQLQPAAAAGLAEPLAVLAWPAAAGLEKQLAVLELLVLQPPTARLVATSRVTPATAGRLTRHPI